MVIEAGDDVPILVGLSSSKSLTKALLGVTATDWMCLRCCMYDCSMRKIFVEHVKEVWRIRGDIGWTYGMGCRSEGRDAKSEFTHLDDLLVPC